MLPILRAYDAEMVELPCGDGSVLIPPSLHGRIFCQLDGELIHRLDGQALAAPSSTEYNNLGGNSLWPAPEGGDFAFNYVAGSDAWVVQAGISQAIPSVSKSDATSARIHKRISLTNRRGVTLDLNYERRVRVAEELPTAGYDLTGFTYHTDDLFAPLGDYPEGEVLLAPWSLEQFPGADGVLAFGAYTAASCVLNRDFYGDPGERIAVRPGQFTFRLGGKDRHQIGIPVACRPTLIGALDANRSLLFLRKTPPCSGLYFNIADNEQAAGPFSAADQYSIFNGGELGFFELETVGAMQVEAGCLAASTLTSETTILKGEKGELLRYLREMVGVYLD